MISAHLAICVIAIAAAVERIEVRLPVSEDRAIDVGQLIAGLAVNLKANSIAPIEAIELPIDGAAGALTRSLIKECMGGKVDFREVEGFLVIAFDPARDATPSMREDRLNHLAAAARKAAARVKRFGLHERPSYRPNDPSRPTICLIHGINSSWRSFTHLIPLIEAEGVGVVLYDYPYDQDLDELGRAFAVDLAAFRSRTGDRASWMILTHSMGALLARDYVEGDTYRNDVTRLLLIGPPNRGAASARGQSVLRWIESVRSINDRSSRAFAALTDGLGEASEDLLPQSGYLKRLNARGRREGVAYHILAGDGGFLNAKTRERVLTRHASLRRRGGLMAGLVGVALADLPEVLGELSEGTGDGCVAVESTRLEGVADHQVIHANHVELIRGPLLFPDPGPVACWTFVVNRLK